MKRLIILMMTLLVAATGWSVTVGDVTGDSQVDISDVNAVINVMLGKNQDPSTMSQADINGDGVVDISDVNTVINIMLGKVTPPSKPTGYDYVWDPTQLPEIHITVSFDEWNRLLQLYDQNSFTKQYILADKFTFIQQGDTTTVHDIGLRLKSKEETGKKAESKQK